ncbi:MAG: DUF3556 domain-containing protein, partial [Anaerolineales bacterium]|nr:DUF3556 domain-containing protein [Anaerolineales bacterium]
IGGALYFLRPSTIKLPLSHRLPIFGRDQRNWLDVALYLAHILQLVRVLTAPAVTPAILWPTIPLLLLLGLNDRAAFLASRPEHYLIGLTCFLFPADSLAGAKLVWLGIWFWAATSKLNHHFPSVITVMLSNSGLIRSTWLRRRLYRHFPDDLRPSRLATTLAHAGTVTEYLFPLLLLFGGLSTGRIFGLASPITLLGLLLMTGFHAFITSNFPMAVPLEWNVMMVYGGYLLFGYHAGVWAFSLSSPWLAAALFLALVVVPAAGNLWPGWISFLLGMRFYAGNWVYSIWLFRDEAEEAIARQVTTTSPLLPTQLKNMYDPDTITSLLHKVIAFRLMHLHGRALHELLPQAIDDIDRYTWRDGELVAGVVAGWNFGEGFLHNECLLAALQKRCNWRSGDLRCIFVDPQPLGSTDLSWRIVDAHDGLLGTGQIAVADLLERQPWPELAPLRTPGHRVSSN